MRKSHYRIRMLRVILSSFAAAALVVSVAGCATAPQEEPEPTQVAIEAPTGTPPTPTESCAGAEGESSSMWLEVDGNYFDVGLVGSSDTVVIFTHQTNRGACGFIDYALWLADQGVRSMLINLCSFGETICAPGTNIVKSGAAAVLTAAQLAREDGATRVISFGASMGGAVAITAAATAGSTGVLDGVVDLAGPLTYSGVETLEFADKITIPMFVATSKYDGTLSPSNLGKLVDAVSSEQVESDPDAGSGHGWDLLHAGKEFAPLAHTLVGFILGEGA